MQQNKHVLALKRMLYYKSTANNAGLVLDIVNKAHERALKETLVVYAIALKLSENGKSIAHYLLLVIVILKHKHFFLLCCGLLYIDLRCFFIALKPLFLFPHSTFGNVKVCPLICFNFLYFFGTFFA